MTHEGLGGDKTRRRQTRRSRNKMRRNRTRKKDRRRTRMKIKNILFLMPCRLCRSHQCRVGAKGRRRKRAMKMKKRWR